MSEQEFEQLRHSKGFSCKDVGALILNYTGTPIDGDKLKEQFQTSNFLSKKDSGLVRASFKLLDLSKKIQKISNAVNLSILFIFMLALI
tara:strand:+ start:59 stop:325 length:267 start_codon:yes stop_codon:yes gene_type:complete